jgi:hypothetical protein
LDRSHATHQAHFVFLVNVQIPPIDLLAYAVAMRTTSVAPATTVVMSFDVLPFQQQKLAYANQIVDSLTIDQSSSKALARIAFRLLETVTLMEQASG